MRYTHQQLRAIRLAAKIDIEDMATVLGRAAVTLSGWERRGCPPSLLDFWERSTCKAVRRALALRYGRSAGVEAIIIALGSMGLAPNDLSMVVDAVKPSSAALWLSGERSITAGKLTSMAPELGPLLDHSSDFDGYSPEAVKQGRTVRGLTAPALAEMIGTTASSIYAWEQATKHPPHHQYVLMLHAFEAIAPKTQDELTEIRRRQYVNRSVARSDSAAHGLGLAGIKTSPIRRRMGTIYMPDTDNLIEIYSVEDGDILTPDGAILGKATPTTAKAIKELKLRKVLASWAVQLGDGKDIRQASDEARVMFADRLKALTVSRSGDEWRFRLGSKSTIIADKKAEIGSIVLDALHRDALPSRGYPKSKDSSPRWVKQDIKWGQR